MVDDVPLHQPSISMAVGNLRLLETTPFIPLKPITLLLGRNSAGKSTFLRSLLLLKQSIQTKSSAPILWFGEHVDFGDFESAVKDHDLKKEITFSFHIDKLLYSKNDIDRIGRRATFMTKDRNQYYENICVTYGIESDDIDNETQRSSISLKMPDIDIDSKILFNIYGASSFSANRNYILHFQNTNMKPFFSEENIFAEPVIFWKRKIEDDQSNAFDIIQRRIAISRQIRRLLRQSVRKNISTSRIRQEAARIIAYPRLTSDALSKLSITDTKTFQNFYTDMASGKKTKILQELECYCQLRFSLDVIEACGKHLTQFFAGINYIEPARARSERYYRLQELSVSQIDSDGQNLPMLLASLNHDQLVTFSKWVESIFGYGIKINRMRGHISIELQIDDMTVNIADTGYGVSQLLPVLAQVWWMGNSNQSRRLGGLLSPTRTRTLAVEQPELHLHPAHQALLADVFASSIENTRDSQLRFTTSFVIETHSEALINRLGELVATCKLPANSIDIVVFGASDGQGEEIAIANFDESGSLVNWPYGFFNAG